MTDRERLVDQIALLEALAHYTGASAERRLAEAVLVRLARRLTDDGTLTDVEAVTVAGREALAAVTALKGPEPSAGEGRKT